MRGTAMLMNRSRNSYIRAPRGGPSGSGARGPASGAFFGFLALGSLVRGGAGGAGASAPFGSSPRGAAPGSAAPATFGSRSLVSAILLSHPGDRLAGLDRDPLHRPLLVPAPPDAGRLPRPRVEQHHVRRRDGGGKFDDPALLVGRGSPLVLLHDVHALHDDPELLGIDVEDFAFLAAVLTRNHAHRVALGDVQLVARRLASGDAGAPALLVDERLHLR